MTAALNAIIATLSAEERGRVKEASEQAQRIVEAAGPFLRPCGVSAEVNEAFARLRKNPPSYLAEFYNPEAARDFCVGLLEENPLLVTLILNPEQQVSLETVALATKDTGIYAIKTTAQRERVAALPGAAPATLASRVRRVVTSKLKRTPRAAKVDFVYTGQSIDNENRMKYHADPNSTQFCDKAARYLETSCGAVTTIHNLATVDAVVRLAEQAGLTAVEGLNIAEAVFAHVHRTMTAEGGLNVSAPGYDSVATSVSAADVRAEHAAGILSVRNGSHGFAYTE